MCSLVIWNVCRVQESATYKKYDVFYNLIMFCRNQSNQPGLDEVLKGENSE